MPIGKARAIVDDPGPGAWNMAVDHALLETANTTGLISVRFYGWSQPTLSLGYFQSSSHRQQHRASLACPVVRRSTGGGAIVHDHEITYSLCVPSDQRWSTANERLYSMMHEILRDLLSQYDIDAQLFEPVGTEPKDQEFLCFLRRSAGDLIVAGNKIGGSAQRRRNKALLQHGSLLIKRSNAAPELAGIEDLAGVKIDPSKLVRRWILRLEERLEIELPLQQLTESENAVAQEIQDSIYAAAPWTNRR